MSQDNVELTRETFERFNRGEYDALLEDLYDPHVVYHVRSDEPDAGVTRGREPILQIWRTWGKLFESLSAAMEEYIDRGEAVIAAGRLCGNGRASGVPVREPYAWVAPGDSGHKKTRARVVGGQSGLSGSLYLVAIEVGTWRECERAASRQPISAGEAPHLEALGARLAELRHEAGLSRRAVAERAHVACSTVERIERGTRRTRRSTLDRLAAALDRPDVAGKLVELAGPALAAESPHAERIARRRARRVRRAQDRAAWESLRRERDAAWAAHAELKVALRASRYVWRHLVHCTSRPPSKL